jgi:hypothetical protein
MQTCFPIKNAYDTEKGGRGSFSSYQMYGVWFSYFSLIGLMMAVWAETDSLIMHRKCMFWLWLYYW